MNRYTIPVTVNLGGDDAEVDVTFDWFPAERSANLPACIDVVSATFNGQPLTLTASLINDLEAAIRSSGEV